MPRLPPFALLNERPPRKAHLGHVAAFFFLFAIPLVLIHLQLFTLPYFWDELGQFVPAALDLARNGWWVAHSAIPNVHPPGVAAYLAVCYKLFGFSAPVTRAAMLLVASAGLLLTFLLAIELSQGTEGAPAFLPPLLLLASPLFYAQSMLAQLDMPAMVLTLLALFLSIRRAHVWAAIACVALVLVKETGIMTPFVFFCFLAWRKQWKAALLYVSPAVALSIWLLVLHERTGHWLGDAEFARYNVSYALQPMHLLAAFARRLFYLFVAEFRWVGTLVLALTVRKCKAFRTPAWALTAAVSGFTVAVVSAFGGAELERYVLPVLPLFYIAIAAGLTALPRKTAMGAAAALLAGLAFFVRWNPPYPFPFENNYSFVDFVHLQQTASEFAERNLNGRRIATAWPYSAGLRNPDLGYVKRALQAIETNDMHFDSVKALPPDSFDALITYTREWAPENGVTQLAAVRGFLRRFYEWAPDITAEQCEALGFEQQVSWSLRGQTVSIYLRKER